jgi:hypothetical protein
MELPPVPSSSAWPPATPANRNRPITRGRAHDEVAQRLKVHLSVEPPRHRLEIVSRDVTGLPGLRGLPRLKKMDWVPAAQLEAFTASANHQGISGGQARHARMSGTQSPRLRMTRCPRGWAAAAAGRVRRQGLRGAPGYRHRDVPAGHRRPPGRAGRPPARRPRPGAGRCAGARHGPPRACLALRTQDRGGAGPLPARPRPAQGRRSSLAVAGQARPADRFGASSSSCAAPANRPACRGCIPISFATRSLTPGSPRVVARRT